MSVVQIEDELGLAQYREELRIQKGVWQTLQQLRVKADADAKLCPQYQALLARAIDRVTRNRSDVLDGPAQLDAGREYVTWYAQQRLDRGVPDRESRRGSSFEPWCAKWTPEPWGRYMRAFSAMTDAPTKTHLTQLKAETVTLIDAYLSIT